MSNPMWNKTLTVFINRISDGVLMWEKHVVNNCFFKSKYQEKTTDRDTAAENGFIVRMPLKGIGFVPYPGSLVFLGSIAEDIDDGESGNSLLEKYHHNSFRVSCLSVNNTGFLQHYYMKGE